MVGYWRTLGQPHPDDIPPPSEGAGPLHIASEAGDVSKVEELLKLPDTDVNVLEGHGYTPLFCATDNSRAGVVIALLSHNSIDPNHGDQYQWTPLFRSLLWPEGKECFCALMRSPLTDFNARETHGFTPLHTAIKHRRWFALRALIRRTTNDRREDYIKAQLANGGVYRRPFCVHKRQPCRCVLPTERVARRANLESAYVRSETNANME